tara:strand:+ start:28 stop:930 length:903 start_codon:yes stop_codon:yes gene_type:complete
MNSPLKNEGFLQGGTYDTTNVSGGVAFRLPGYSPGTQTTPMFGPVNQNLIGDSSKFMPPALPSDNGGSGGMSPTATAGLIGGLSGIAQGLIGRKKRKARQNRAKDEYQKRRAEFERLDTSNLAAGFKNPYADLENTFEDLTVNQQQAQFESQQNARSQANIMQNLRGAAGASGIGGLAQALANQSQVANQRASASVGAQEAANQRAAAQGAARVQQLEAGGEMTAQQTRLQGADRARGLEYDKTGTFLGMAQADKAAADKAVADSNAALAGGIGSVVGAVASTFVPSPEMLAKVITGGVS